MILATYFDLSAENRGEENGIELRSYGIVGLLKKVGLFSSSPSELTVGEGAVDTKLLELVAAYVHTRPGLLSRL